jgi:membrane protease YdiL (CAAX protease family)
VAELVAAPRAASDGALLRYAVGVVVTVVAILSQYFVPQNVPALLPIYSSLPGDLFIVYGIPTVAFAVLVGAGPLRHWSARMRIAAVDGLAFYAAALIATFAVLAAMLVVYELLDPSAIQLLTRQNPALTQASGNPWFWVGFSFVIGAFEETIFRGWIFGFWRNRATNWVVPAIWTSVLFAGVHLYYGTTYGPAAPLIFPGLFLLGFAFAATYQTTGGNLVMVAFLHGLFDAAAFLTLLNTNAGLLLRYLPVLIGAVLLVVRFLAPNAGSTPPPIPTAASALPPAFPSSPGPPPPLAPPSPPSGPPGTVL